MFNPLRNKRSIKINTMEGFTYSSIFETKGIEYIVIISFFICLLSFWFILNRRKEIGQKIKKVFSSLSTDIMKIPQGIFHSKNHTWIYMEKSGAAKVGMDDFILRTTGDISLQNLRSSGEIVKKGDLLAEIVKRDKTLKVYSPITGEIVTVNELATVAPEMLSEDTYSKGWIYKIKPTNWKAEIQSLYLAEETINWSKNEVARYKDFVAEAFKKQHQGEEALILQDGGEIADQSLAEFDSEVWNDFQSNFLKM